MTFFIHNNDGKQEGKKRKRIIRYQMAGYSSQIMFEDDNFWCLEVKPQICSPFLHFSLCATCILDLSDIPKRALSGTLRIAATSGKKK